jgi:hypothetical protein
MIKSTSFYNNYHGHKVKDLQKLYKHLKNINPDKHFIYLAGDSSLDNKYWLKNEKKLPMFHYLNGKDSKDYVQRVEPSNVGGKKLAKGFIGQMTCSLTR